MDYTWFARMISFTRCYVVNKCGNWAQRVHPLPTKAATIIGIHTRAAAVISIYYNLVIQYMYTGSIHIRKYAIVFLNLCTIYAL